MPIGITNFQFKIKYMAVVLGDRRLSPSGVGEVQEMRARPSWGSSGARVGRRKWRCANGIARGKEE
jgi:hypothetical protein